MTILLASSVRTLGFIEMKHSRPHDLKSSSNVSLPFAWITGPRKTCKDFSNTYDLIQTFALLLASIKSDKFSEVTTLWSPKALRCLSALPIDVVAANQALVVTSRLYCN